MKSLLATAAALVALLGTSAMAADLERPAYKAPPPLPPPPVYTWSGCYLGGGGGYGMWNQDIYTETYPALAPESTTTTAGGRGWFGTVQVGCDYQFAGDWVIGAFGDWDFGNLHGAAQLPYVNYAVTERQKWAWGAGGRIGYVIWPQLLGFVSAGFTEAHFDGGELFDPIIGNPSPFEHISGNTYKGWFLGTGYEYAMKWLPGLFWKTEYRYSSYRGADLAIIADTTGLATTDAIHSRKYEQTIRSELVWRFNWWNAPIRGVY